MIKVVWIILTLGGLMLLILSVGCATIDRSWYLDIDCKQKIARYYTAMPYGKDYAVFEKQNDQNWQRSSEPFATFEAANESAKATAYETPDGVFVGIEKAKHD